MLPFQPSYFQLESGTPLFFFEKSFPVSEICFKVKVLKTLNISSDCHIKTCGSLKQRAFLKIHSTVF